MRDTTAPSLDQPSHHDLWVRAMRAGDHATAWALCERQAVLRPPEERDDPSLPYHQRWVWDLAELDGRDVLVRCYHGLGDTIQFLRFLPELRRRAASVTLEIQPRLIALLPPDCADRVVPFDPAHPLKPAERDVEIMELSFALRTPPGDCPPPYLGAVPAALPPGTIGLCCTSGDWDSERSVPPALLTPLLQGRPGVTLDAQATALPVLNPQGCPFDMAETAALVAARLALGTRNRAQRVVSERAPLCPARPGRLGLGRLPRRPRPRPCPSTLTGARPMNPVECCPHVPVSWGELVDKITILQIKATRIAARDARANVAHELASLRGVAGEALYAASVAPLMEQLQAVNEQLWEIEDKIREREAEGDFGQRFVELARSVYKTNDLRAAIKRRINEALGSELVEEKSYADWASVTG
jgi:hypothetical protein